MSNLDEKVKESLAYIATITPLRPEIALVLGSGLGKLESVITEKTEINYQDIPHFCSSTAPGHAGKLIFGKLGAVEVVCMQGRIHYYEGYGMEQTVYPVRVLAKMGIKYLLLSNASGGINLSFKPGDLMLLTDHINFMGINPLVGANEASFGVRFSDMSYAYNPALRQIALEAAAELGEDLKQGVYLACSGPSYETPAEIRMFRQWGADAVGMSTVPEVIVANHSGLKTLAISCVSNMAAGILDQPLTEEEVLETGEKSSQRFCALMTRIVEKIDGR